MAGESKKNIEGTFTVLEPNKIFRGLALFFMIAGIPMFIGFLNRIFPPGVLGIHFFVISIIAWLGATRQNILASRKERNVRFTPEGVFVNGVLVVKKEEIVDGQFQPRQPRIAKSFRRRHGSSVRLYGKRKRILFEAEMDEGRAIDALRVLGLDASQRRAQFYASSPLFATLPRQLGFTWGLMGGVGALVVVMKVLFGINAAPLIPFSVVPIFIAAMMPTRLDVGVDGLLIRWLWKKRFLPMNQIAQVTPSGDRDINVVLTSGETVVIHTSMSRSRGMFAQNRRDAVLARVQEAFSVHKSGGPPVDVAALVGRGSRKRSEWLDALLKMRDASGYRAAVVRDEDLWRVVEDPAAPEDARAGAAVALRSGLDAEGKARVRVAAEATASPKLRVVLDAAAGESEEEATKALHELVGEDEPAEKLRAG